MNFTYTDEQGLAICIQIKEGEGKHKTNRTLTITVGDEEPRTPLEDPDLVQEVLADVVLLLARSDIKGDA